jgi:thiol-disulfide isomerase/thioredoxin
MRAVMAVVRSLSSALRGTQINVLQRPRSRRELAQRLGVVGLVALAGAGAYLAGPDRADVGEIAAVADESFRAQRQELDDARADLADLREAEAADAEQVEELETRVVELETATFLGYLPRDGDGPSVGSLVPDFRLLDLEGRPVQLSALGRPAIVNFWASWCGFCIEEMPDFERLHQAAGDRVAVIGVNRAEPLHTAELFAGHTGVTYTLLLDLDDALARPYRIIGMPTTLYVRADGIVDTVKIGFHTFEEMAALTNRLLDEEFAVDLGPIDESFSARARDLLDSQTANHAVAGELFDRLAADPALAEDAAWQRNVTAQAQIWVTNFGAWRDLHPPSAVAAPSAAVKEAFEILQVAGGLLVTGVNQGDAERIGRGVNLFGDAAALFAIAADDLRAALDRLAAE